MHDMKKIFFVTIISLLLASCSSQKTDVQNSITQSVQLTPYYTATLTPTQTKVPPGVPTATLAPTVTPTPRIYEVKANDTLIVIAFRNGLTLEELQAANPDVNAYNLSIGMKLNIPAAKSTPGTQEISTPTPAPVVVHPPKCVPSLTGGLYCFALVENNLDRDLKNLSAEFRLSNPVTGDVVTQTAQLLLNKLQKGISLPFYAYFNAPVPLEPQVGIQLLTATGVESEDGSPFPLAISDLQILIAPDGLSVMVSGNAGMDAGGWSVSQILLAAVAYDDMSEVVGVRRSEVKLDLQPGQIQDFNFKIYSTGESITRVEVFGEGLP
jgi:LysM repeat protein